MPENTKNVHAFSSEDEDEDEVTWSVFGIDAALVSRSMIQGWLSSVPRRTSRVPQDQGQDNFYEVTVRVSDGTLHSDEFADCECLLM